MYIFLIYKFARKSLTDFLLRFIYSTTKIHYLYIYSMGAYYFGTNHPYFQKQQVIRICNRIRINIYLLKTIIYTHFHLIYLSLLFYLLLFANQKKKNHPFTTLLFDLFKKYKSCNQQLNAHIYFKHFATSGVYLCLFIFA